MKKKLEWETPPETPKQVLSRALKLLSRRGGWIQGQLEDEDCGFCLIGVIYEASGGTDKVLIRLQATEAVRDVISEKTGRGSIAEFNDAPGRKKEDILAVIRSAMVKV